jgi:tetratricopeptide (TPR) repeat protein
VEVETLAWLLGGMVLARYDNSVTTMVTAKADEGRVSGLLMASRVALVALGMVVVAACVLYMRADAAYSRGLVLFESSRFGEAAAAHRTAIAIDPFSDVARVGLSDTALYRPGDAAASDESLKVLDQGLAMEPLDYDLLLARARLLKARGAAPAQVFQAYEEAVQAYPLGIQVRREAMAAAVSAGDSGATRALADGILELVPQDPAAQSIRASGQQ